MSPKIETPTISMTLSSGKEPFFFFELSEERETDIILNTLYFTAVSNENDLLPSLLDFHVKQTFYFSVVCYGTDDILPIHARICMTFPLVEFHLRDKYLLVSQ